MKKILVPTLLLLSILTSAKAQQPGIQFETYWDKVVVKAKAEHKYIFVDCYASWCGPCKWMDANVYPKQAVGDVYNQQFIAIRVQMDRTNADNDTVKRLYHLANYLAKTFSVNAYPTFLFFDENGKPVNKATGSMDENAFIALAADAQDPQKQYYANLNNFQPGTLDTGQEKGLALSFASTDKVLATKLALDYFSRIPQDQIPTTENMSLLQRLKDNPAIKKVPGDYLQRLSVTQMGQLQNLGFAENFRTDSAVKMLAKKYINSLPEEKLYNKRIIQFMVAFTDSPQDNRAFDLFYRHTKKVDAIMGRDAAEMEVQTLIRNEVFKPALERAKLTGVTPNFDSVKTVITRKYNTEYADRVIIAGKPSWYSYLIQTEHKGQYWPQYVDALTAEVHRFRIDTVSAAEEFINDMSYKIFAFDTVKDQLVTVAGWMKAQTIRNPGDPSKWDTYASLLYKIGEKDQAIIIEEKALDIATRKNDKDNITWCSTTIEKMKKGEQIWLEKEYQQ